MNSLLIAYLIWLGVRFIWLKEGKCFSGRRYLGMLGTLLIATSLLFGSRPEDTALLSIVLMSLCTVLYLVERRTKTTSPAARTLSLLAAVPLVNVLFLSVIDFNDHWHGLRIFSTEWLALLTAALLCLKESNFVIRWFFRHYGLVEKVKALNDAPSTDNGRIIGNLERLLLLLFLWEGAALAATFIVAVKGLARFKKMEEHQAFAEYVIIGTFLSVLLTLLIYKATRLLY